MRKFYSEPVLDVTFFAQEDVLTVSTSETYDISDYYGEV